MLSKNITTKHITLLYLLLKIKMVRDKRLELLRRKALDHKSSVSANSTNLALLFLSDIALI